MQILPRLALSSPRARYVRVLVPHHHSIGHQVRPRLTRDGWRNPPDPESQFMPKNHGHQQRQSARPPLTHFLALPLCTPETRPQLVENLGRFKEDITQENGQRSSSGNEYNSRHGNENEAARTILPTRKRRFQNSAQDIQPAPEADMEEIMGKLLDDDKLGELNELLDKKQISTQLESPGEEDEHHSNSPSSGEQLDRGDSERPVKVSTAPSQDRAKDLGEYNQVDEDPAPSVVPTKPVPRPSIPDVAFRHPGCLHFTLGVMSLPSPEKLGLAKAFLRNLDLPSLLPVASPPTNQHPLTTSLRTLSSLPAAEHATSLYASPVPSEAVYAFASKVRTAFIEAGLLIDDGRGLLLHATLVNTIYAMPRKRLRGGQKGQKARTLLERAKEEEIQKLQEEARVGKPEREIEGDLLDAGDGEGMVAAGIKRIQKEYEAKLAEREQEAKSQRVKIDARGLVKKYENMVWAKDVVLDRLTICEMGAKKVYENEEGMESGVQIRFPGRKKVEVDERKVVDEVYREVAGVDIPWEHKV